MKSNDPGRIPVSRIKHLRPAACLAIASSSLVLAAPALATESSDDTTVKPAGSGCAERVFSKVFRAFHDRGLYTLAPDGGFEAGAEGWELGDGATVVDESSSILLGDALGAKSLELAPGASATTPAICVAKGFPGFRFATRSAGEDRGALRVQVLYGEGRKSKKTGRIKAGAVWKVTRKLSLAQGRFRVKRGKSANVRLKFTASGGPVRMDDVYVDPRFTR
jgi:hypothetical protein